MAYLWSDAWLLQAIAIASQNAPATLAQVLAAADGVNHALPTDEELHGGFSRLTAGGFVTEIDGCFTMTAAVPSHVTARMLEGGWNRGRQAASEFLNAEPWSALTKGGDPRNAVVYRGLTPERILAADQEYRETITRKFRR
jgi:hypothetical protein